jgi:hypothetical protein
VAHRTPDEAKICQNNELEFKKLYQSKNKHYQDILEFQTGFNQFIFHSWNEKLKLQYMHNY